MSLLAKYTKRAERMSTDALLHHIADIRKCWAVNPEFQDETLPYGQKLWAEYDAYTVEIAIRKGY